MLNIVSNIIIASLDNKVYNDIIQGINEQIEEDPSMREGVLEFVYNDFEVVFWFSLPSDGLASMLPEHWMILTFRGGIRCSNDFEISRLIKMI